MEALAYGIAVAGVANAISLVIGYFFKYRMSKAKRDIYLTVTQQIVTENSDRIIEAVETSLKQQVAERLERFDVKE